jgi:hypothetical protein
LILAGCTRIYLVDKSKKGSDVEIISDSNFLKNTYKNTGLSNLLIARTLLSIGKKFRSNISKFCPIIYKNWSENCKRQHEQFEKELNEFIHILDDVINQNLDEFDK